MTELPEPRMEEESLALLSSPVIRLAILVVVLVVVVACVGFLVLNTMMAARAQPIDVAVYPGASLVVEQQLAAGHDQLLYVSSDDPNAVADFYIERYDLDEDQTCERIDNALGAGDEPPFKVVCNMDNSIINARQSAVITIQPNVSNTYAGATLILIERFWQG